jgi:hypothetical protein
MVSHPRHPATGLDAGLGERVQSQLAAEAHSNVHD